MSGGSLLGYGQESSGNESGVIGWKLSAIKPNSYRTPFASSTPTQSTAVGESEGPNATCVLCHGGWAMSVMMGVVADIYE